MDLTNDDVLKILKIIDESGYNDIRLEIGDLKLHVQKQPVQGAEAAEPYTTSSLAKTAQAPALAPAVAKPAAATAPQAQAPAPAAAMAGESIPEGLVAVSAPILGTFYRAPSPGEKPFVEVGQKVTSNDTLCLIEVMKLFNSVKAGTSGTVVKILVENGKMVEHGQLLMLIEPGA